MGLTAILAFLKLVWESFQNFRETGERGVKLEDNRCLVVDKENMERIKRNPIPPSFMFGFKT